MRQLQEHLAAIEQLDSLQDEKEREAARDRINAGIRATFSTDSEAARAFLEDLRICEPEQALAAMSLIEALAGAGADGVRVLVRYFDMAIVKVAECPGNDSAVQVLTTYAFLEHGSNPRNLEMLPRYLQLSRSELPQLRRAAVDLLAGFEVAAAPAVRDELVRLLRDADSQVRRGAEDLLREEGALPAGHRPSLLDRIRRLFS